MLRNSTLLTAVLAILASGCVPELKTKGGDAAADWEAPTNRWIPGDGPPEGDISCGGYDVGDTLCDLRLTDQHGDEVSLWQFWGHIVVLDISTMWCRPCQELAVTTQDTAEHFAPHGMTYLTVLQEDVEGAAPKPADLEEWGETFGIEAPILNDGGLEAGDAIYNGTYPALLLIDRDMRVVDRVAPPDGAILDAAIEDLLE